MEDPTLYPLNEVHNLDINTLNVNKQCVFGCVEIMLGLDYCDGLGV
jgi:hypothetical protein